MSILTKEKVFHDNWAENIDVTRINVDDAFSVPTSPENRWIREKLGNISGKKLLELGCGAGEASVYFAKQGASVMATDLSDKMLEVVKVLAKNNGVSVDTACCSSTSIPFADESFDIIYAANILHHVDIEVTIAEVLRVLKPNGIFVSWDPLVHNPVIQVYRRIAEAVRTEDEHPLHWREIARMRQAFTQVDYTATWFATLIIFLKFYFIDRVHPGQERYWKKIIYDYQKIAGLYTMLEKFDTVFLKLFPFLRRYCWNIVFYCRK